MTEAGQLRTASPLGAAAAAELLTKAEVRERNLVEELARVKEAKRFWGGLVRCVDAQHWAAAMRILERSSERLDENALATAAAMRDEIAPQAREATRRFARDFPSLARESGLKIDATSRHPNYSFRDGFLKLEVDERAFSARVKPRDGSVVEVGLDLPLVVDELHRQEERLFRRSFDADQFLRSLHTAYVAVLRADKKPVGEPVPVRRLANRLAKNVKRFSLDEFNVDLGRLARSGHTTYKGAKLALNHTRDARHGMLLYGMEGGGYVNLCAFRPAARDSNA